MRKLNGEESNFLVLELVIEALRSGETVDDILLSLEEFASLKKPVSNEIF